MKMNYFKAKPSKSFILNANGSLDRTRSLFAIKNYPRIDQGQRSLFL
jgi:hypothetical protein